MSIWSVDSVIKPHLDNQKAIARFIRYHENVSKSPGIRYIPIDTENTPIYFGQSYEINSSVLFGISGQQPFSDLFTRREDIEENLDVKWNEHLNASRALSIDIADTDYSPPSKKPEYWAKIHVHNVGQGDTIVLELPNKEVWLVDAWLQKKPRQQYFKNWFETKFGNNHINKVIISHFHYDHIHSIPYIIENFIVDEVLIPDSLKHKTSSAIRALHYAGDRLRTGISRITTRLGSLNIHIIQISSIPSINEQTQHSKDPNDHELAVILSTDESFAFLSGDIPGVFFHDITNTLFANSNSHKIDYYKVSHHGSRTGFYKDFFDNTKVNESIISCGRSNRYGHPHIPPINHLSGNVTITHRGGDNVYTYCLK